MKKISSILTITLFVVFFFLAKTNTHAQETITLFSSNTCPYCHEVIEFIEENGLDSELEIQILESSSEGFQEIYEKACNIPLSQGGYPTLHSENGCVFGRSNSIKALSQISGLEDVLGESENNPGEEDTVNENLETTKEPERIPHPVPTWMMMAMFIGPAILIYIGYLIIKKLNL